MLLFWCINQERTFIDGYYFSESIYCCRFIFQCILSQWKMLEPLFLFCWVFFFFNLKFHFARAQYKVIYCSESSFACSISRLKPNLLGSDKHGVNIRRLTLTVGDVGSSKSRFTFSESTSCLLFFILSRRSPVGLSVDLARQTHSLFQWLQQEI